MKRYNFLIIIVLSLALFGMMYSGGFTSHSYVPAGITPTTSPITPNIIITSHINNEKQLLYLPENSTNLQMYPLWNISILTSQAFLIRVNGKQVSSGSGPITMQENMSLYRTVDMNITLGNTVYHYSGISIVGIPPKVAIYSVSIVTNYPGQSQYLQVKPGLRGELTYPDWNITMLSSNNVTYKIYENGLEITSGTTLGKRYFDLNITGNTTSVIVVLGSHIYNFKGELVAHVPISQYYKPKPPPLVATALDVAISFVRGIVIVFLAVLSGMMLSRRYIMAKKDMEPQRRW
jgi:hypothetical protein